MPTDETITRTEIPEFLEASAIPLTSRLMPLLDPAQAVDTSKFAPTVAAETALQQQARGLSGGLGSFEPFLTQAGADATAAQQFTGPQAFQEFMSPYQQEVIDTSLAALQRERDIARQQIGAGAAQLGAFGGGRQGLQEGAFDAETALGKAQLEAQLRAQGFQQAQQAAQQSFANQQQLSAQQQGLAQLAPQLAQQQITGIGQLGQQQQLQSQAVLDAQAQAEREAAFEQQQRLGFVGQQLTGLIGGYPASTTYQTTTSAPPSPLSQLLGVGAGLGGILGQLGAFGQ
tara:strand:- start:5186 stop:6046 length:861 start_codon:yes stop_codon:yes gene_type:complete